MKPKTLQVMLTQENAKNVRILKKKTNIAAAKLANMAMRAGFDFIDEKFGQINRPTHNLD